MFRGMAPANDNLPVVFANGDGFAVDHSPETFGQGIDGAAKVAELLFVTLKPFFLPARGAVEAQGHFGCRLAGVSGHGAAHQKLLPGHP